MSFTTLVLALINMEKQVLQLKMSPCWFQLVVRLKKPIKPNTRSQAAIGLLALAMPPPENYLH
jgi:hypothetical protein